MDAAVERVVFPGTPATRPRVPTYAIRRIRCRRQSGSSRVSAVAEFLTVTDGTSWPPGVQHSRNDESLIVRGDVVVNPPQVRPDPVRLVTRWQRVGLASGGQLDAATLTHEVEDISRHLRDQDGIDRRRARIAVVAPDPLYGRRAQLSGKVRGCVGGDDRAQKVAIGDTRQTAAAAQRAPGAVLIAAVTYRTMHSRHGGRRKGAAARELRVTRG